MINIGCIFSLLHYLVGSCSPFVYISYTHTHLFFAFRLDSAYRTWVHMKSSLFDGEEAYLIEFRKRELYTALGTAKWQVCGTSVFVAID